MTNDNPKSNCCGAEVIMSHCKACGKSLNWYEYKNDNPQCQKCNKPLFTWDMGCGSWDSYCNCTRTAPSKTECERLRESGNDLGSVYVPAPKCPHDGLTDFKNEDGSCSICKPVEPSVEEMVHRIIQEKRHGFMTLNNAFYFAELVVEQLRKERNRK